MNDRAADRLCLITGATSGIGRATAQQLAADGATTVLVARDATKGEATAREITEATGNDRLQVLVADLSSQASIRALVEAFRGDHDRLDVLGYGPRRMRRTARRSDRGRGSRRPRAIWP